MQLKLPELGVNFIGDPHFGKKFPYVPLHRKGEREEAQLNEFIKQLNEPCEVCIMVGDLFDTYIVPNEVILDVYDAIRSAAIVAPERHFIMMEGNHDIARNSETVTSFDILVKMLDDMDNVYFYQKIDPFYLDDGSAFLICPYAPFSTAEEEVSKFKDQKFKLAVGHWDTDEVAGPHNLAPLELLSTMTDTIVTGHVHTAETKKVFGANFYRTGSLLPYSHSEDPDETLYVTRTIEQVAIEMAENPDCYKDKCLRLLLTDSEDVPENIDSLQLTVKRLNKFKDDEPLEVEMGVFNFQELFNQSFKENDVPDNLRDEYWEYYQQKAATDVSES